MAQYLSVCQQHALMVCLWGRASPDASLPVLSPYQDSDEQVFCIADGTLYLDAQWQEDPALLFDFRLQRDRTASETILEGAATAVHASLHP